MHQRKLILSIQYEKNLNYLVNSGKGNRHSIVPVNPKKSLRPYKIYNHYSDNKIISNLNFNKNDNTLTAFMKKYNSGKRNDIKSRSIISEFNQNNEDINIIRSNNKIQNVKDQNHSKILMLLNDSGPNELPVNKIFEKKDKKESSNNLNNNINSRKVSNKDILTKIDFNMFEYFCYCWRKKYKTNIEIFDFGVSFYKSQMSIINIFNVVFLTQIMITNNLNKKNHNYFDQIIEIPIKS